MAQNRFLCARRRAFPVSLLALLGASVTATVATSNAAWAQTAPVIEAPAAGAGSVGGSLLLEDAFDSAPEGADAPQPSVQVPPATFSIANDEAASGARALSWKYTLGRDEPRLSWQKAAPVDLSGARSIGLKVKSDQGAAIEIWFETKPEGAQAISSRYSTTIWSAGGGWQELSIDRARFIGHLVTGGTVAKEPIPTQLWDTGWSQIVRWGVSDATNTWRLFAGQTRSNGPRTIWLDDLKISTGLSPNPALPVFAPPPPVAPRNQKPNQENDFDNGGFDNRNGFDNGNGGPGFDPDGNEFDPNFDPRNAPGGFPQVLEGQATMRDMDADDFGNPNGPGDGVDDEPEGDEPPAPAEVQVQAVVQDAWGALESWIPINGTTSAPNGARAGLKWNMVRLANRDAMLISTINPEVLRGFPSESVRKRPRAANVVIGAPERLLRIAVAVTSSKPTIMQLALHESDGGVWTVPVPIDLKRKTFVPMVRLADMVNAPTRRDSNGQLDLDRVVAVSLQDLGAQKNMAGPNEITFRGMTWIY